MQIMRILLETIIEKSKAGKYCCWTVESTKWKEVLTPLKTKVYCKVLSLLGGEGENKGWRKGNLAEGTHCSIKVKSLMHGIQ